MDSSLLKEIVPMAVDMFLKLDGIKGESADHKHKDEIHIESFSWGMSQTGAHGSGGGGGAGKVSVHDISITKFVDKSSPALMLACCNGKHIKDGLITVRKAGEKPLEYLKIKLVDILISGVQNAGHGGDQLTENVTINFAKFHVEYQEQKADGTGSPGGEMGWDVKANQKA
jgi:type VI secretion system secreted protein Hcp